MGGMYVKTRKGIQGIKPATTTTTRREFFKEILYKNIPIIAIQHSKMNFVDTFGDFSHC